MNRKEFVTIFKMLLVEVAELLPERGRVCGLKIYSSEDGNVRIPIIITKSEMSVWLEALKPSSRESVKETLRCRLAMISSMALRATNQDDESVDYDFQVVLNIKALREVVNCAKREYATLGLEMSRSVFVEAMCVSYVCHELRHLVQLFSLETKDFHSNLKKIPVLRNDKIPLRRLKKFWLDEIAYQMGLYRAHYAKYATKAQRGNNLGMEKDALVVQLLSLDCWLCGFLSRDEKILKLQEILLSKKES